MLSIEIGIDRTEFQEEVYSEITSYSSLNTLKIIGNAILNQLKHQLNRQPNAESVKRFNAFWICPYYGKLASSPSLFQMSNSKIINLGYYELELVTDINVHNKLNIDFSRVFFSFDRIRIKTKTLKTIHKHKVEIHGACIETDSVLRVLQMMELPCKCPVDYLVPYISGVWDNALQFICRVCGKSYLCECFRSTMTQRYQEFKSQRIIYGQGALAERFVNVYESSEFRDGICHLCRDIPSDLFYCHSQYGSNVLVHYGPYISNIAVEKNIDKREAENHVREILGIPKIGEGWVSEVELLNLFKDIFPNEKIIHQASPSWLGLQRFDIFLPMRRLAIEYQGLQHYEPVEFFGGEEGYEKTKERDKKKAELCEFNNVKLLYFRYDEPITKEYVFKKLKACRFFS